MQAEMIRHIILLGLLYQVSYRCKMLLIMNLLWIRHSVKSSNPIPHLFIGKCCSDHSVCLHKMNANLLAIVLEEMLGKL